MLLGAVTNGNTMGDGDGMGLAYRLDGGVDWLGDQAILQGIVRIGSILHTRKGSTTSHSGCGHASVRK